MTCRQRDFAFTISCTKEMAISGTRMIKPRGVVAWISIEENAEGGDALYFEAKRRAAFLDGFTRVAEGGGVALYRDITVRQPSLKFPAP